MIRSKINFKRSFRFFVIAFGFTAFIVLAYVFSAYLDLRKPGLVVLLYHEIVSDDQQRISKYQHSLSDFNEQLDYLVQEGYQTVLPSEISGTANELKNDDRIIMLTFDDGTPDHYHTVYPLLSERNFKGVFFVIAGNMNKQYALSDDQILEMSMNHMEIGSHSYSHPFLDVMDSEDVYYELRQSKNALSDIIGKDVTAFAPPGGWYNDLVVSISKDVGYESFFTCRIGVNDIEQAIFKYNRIEVLGDMTIDEFQKLLNPSEILPYKLEQSFKFIVHRMIGSENYQRLGSLVRNILGRGNNPVEPQYQENYGKKQTVIYGSSG